MEKKNNKSTAIKKIAKNPVGQPKWKPSDIEREMAKELIEKGVPISKIAQFLNVSYATFQNNFEFDVRPGKPAHVVTQENRDLVITLANRCVTKEEISSHLKISDETFNKYYASDYEFGRIDTKVKLVEVALSEALTNKNQQLIMFLLERKFGFTKETINKNEITGKDGGAVRYEDIRNSLFEEIDRIRDSDD